MMIKLVSVPRSSTRFYLHKKLTLNNFTAKRSDCFASRTTMTLMVAATPKLVCGDDWYDVFWSDRGNEQKCLKIDASRLQILNKTSSFCMRLAEHFGTFWLELACR
jgi:hypothetical protein